MDLIFIFTPAGLLRAVPCCNVFDLADYFHNFAYCFNFFLNHYGSFRYQHHVSKLCAHRVARR